MKLFSKFLVFLAIVLSLYSARTLVNAQEAATSEQTAPVNANVTKFTDYYRFSFKSTDYLPFEISVDGNDLLIDFDKANNLDLGKYIYADSLVRSFGSSGDGKSYVIRINGDNAKVRKYIGDDNETGFDLFVSDEKSQRKTVMMSSLPGEEEGATTAENKPFNQFAQTQVITYPLDFVGPPKVDQVLINEEDFVGPPQYDPKKYAVYEIEKAVEKGAIVPYLEVDNKGFKLSFPLTDIESVSAAAMVKDDIATIVFNSINKIQLGEVAPNSFVKKIGKIPSDKFRIIELTLNKKKLAKGNYTQAFYKDKQSWIFEFYKVDDETKKFDTTPLNIIAENNFKEKRLLTKADSVVGPVDLPDHDTGSIIKAFLIKDNATGVLVPREFVDVKILPSLQGVFIEEKSDYMAYENTDKKLVISKLSNMIISDEVLSSEGEVKNALLASNKIRGVFLDDSIFPFPLALAAKDTSKKGDKKKDADKKDTEEETDNEDKKDKEKDAAKKEKGADDEATGESNVAALDEKQDELKLNLIEDEDALNSEERKDITNVSLEYVKKIISEIGEKKSDLKLQLAQLYFSKGLYAESLGTLQDLKASDPGYKEMFKVDAMIGVTEYMTEKFGDAFDAFSGLLTAADKNKTYNEILLWQWASKTMYNIKKRNNEESPIDIDFASSFDKFMQQYPLDLRYKLGLMYIDEKLKATKTDEAKNILDIISYGGIPKKYGNDTKYYHALIAEKEGNTKLASAVYEQLGKETDDRKNRAKALVELTKMQLLKSQITTDAAIEKFLQASTIWRDDYFEMDVLEIVGHLYVSQKNYMKALDNWKQIANNFPETTESVFILGKMKQLFVDLFDTGIAYKMKPLETLKLYFGFRELTPAGEVGDRITRKVAQFFITADMMDEAIKIVEHQIKYRSQGEDKGKLALWLYKINLDNRDLDGAEAALNLVKDDEISKGLIEQKNYDKAYLTALRGDYDKALDMVKNDFTSPAQKVRGELFWKRENWFGVMNTIESRLKDIRETKPLPLTKDELNDINRLIVAYSAQGENKKLEAIKQEFSSRIPSADDELLFNYLTKGSTNIDYNNFDNTVELDHMERFLDEYSFLPGQDWKSVIAILEPKVSIMVGKTSDELSRQNKLDIVKLAIAYSMYTGKDDKEANDMKKKVALMARDFKDIKVDRFTIDAFNIFDDRFMPKENDAVFEGKIKVTDIPQFVDYYKKANKFSELNISIRDKFKN